MFENNSVNRAVVKALGILEHLMVYKDGRTLTQLAEDLRLPVSSVSDIVKTLVKLGYIQRDGETRGYVLSLKLMDLGQTYLQEMDLYRISVPLLGQVSKKFDAVAGVYLFDPGMRKILLVAEEAGLRICASVGSCTALCCTVRDRERWCSPACRMPRSRRSSVPSACRN